MKKKKEKKIKTINTLQCLSPHWAALATLDAFRYANMITEKQAQKAEKYLNNPEFSKMHFEDYLEWRKFNVK